MARQLASLLCERGRAPAGESLSLENAAGSQGWLQFISGSGQADGQPLAQGDGLGFGAGNLGAFTAGSAGVELLLFDLR